MSVRDEQQAQGQGSSPNSRRLVLIVVGVIGLAVVAGGVFAVMTMRSRGGAPAQVAVPPAPPPAPAEVPVRREKTASRFPQPGLLAVTAHPRARVFVDDKDTGRTSPIPPDSPLSLAPGRHLVRLEIAGKRFAYEMDIKPGQLSVLREN